MKVDPLEIIYCKNCRYFRHKKINEYSAIYSCAKDEHFNIETPELRCNKPCYCKKYFKKKKALKKS